MDAIEPSLERAPIHSIVVSESEDKYNVLQTLLTYSQADVNLMDLDGMTPLHLAVKVCLQCNLKCFLCVLCSYYASVSLHTVEHTVLCRICSAG